jgi:striatin 1/3/4
LFSVQNMESQSDSIPMPPTLQHYTFPGVLHYLQVEWRRFERDRNEWEIERSELKVLQLHKGEGRFFGRRKKSIGKSEDGSC